MKYIIIAFVFLALAHAHFAQKVLTNIVTSILIFYPASPVYCQWNPGDHLPRRLFEDLIEKECSLDDIEEAFTFASNSKPVRVGIKIGE